MKDTGIERNITSRSLSKLDPTNTVRRWEWLVDEQQAHELAERLRSLRNSSEHSNGSIAEYVGVRERTVAGWASPTNPKPPTYAHTKKVAELFDVDVNWLWNGRKTEAPDLNGSISEQLASIQEGVTQLLELVAPIAGAQAAADAPQPKPQRRSRSARESRTSVKKRRVANGPAG